MGDYWPTGGWRESKPEDRGVDSDLLFKADREIKSSIKRINSFLVIKDGYLIFENYYNGYGEDEVQCINSITKSIVSTLIGITLDKGYIKGIDENIYKFFSKDSIEELDYAKKEVTLEKVLSMTSGIFWGPRKMTEPFGSKMREHDDWAKFVLELPIKEDLLGEFQYNSGNSQLLSVLISKVSNMTTMDFTNKYLFEPLGISKIKETPVFLEGFKNKVQGNESVWLQDPMGNSIGGFGLYLKPRDIAKIGYLYMKEGCWDGNQVVSREWVEMSTKEQSEGNELGRYGFQWWIRNISDYEAYFALGYGGQYIINIPKLDLVVVFTSSPDTKLTTSKDPINLVSKYIVPAVTRKF